MTTNQIQYHVLGETTRHDRATEEETHRSNLVAEQLSRDNLREVTRSNRMREKETSKHNRATEKETRRSDKAQEREIKRSNKAKEREARRSNKANESITVQSNLANQGLTEKKIDLEAAARDKQLAEVKRSNLVTEGLRRVEADIKRGNLNLGFENLAELTRHNMKQESLEAKNNFVRNAVSIADTMVKAVKNSRDYRLASKENKAKIDKINAEIAKIAAETEASKALLPHKKAESVMSTIESASRTVGRILTFGLGGRQ